MLCSNASIFPYVIFASGCDFHHTETIAKRLEMMNMGIPNHYLEITKTNQPENQTKQFSKLMSEISVKKVLGHGIATICIKSHKYDVLPHGSSRWQKTEIENICKKMIDLSLNQVTQ